MISKKPPKCRFCKVRMTEHKPIHDECIAPWWAAKKAKDAAIKVKVTKILDRQRREKMKTIADRIAEAQKEFNGFIRARDRLAGHPCISSGRALDWSGNETDAGHYLSRGSAPQHRFNEDNCHAQSKRENRYLAGNAGAFRVRLIARIGLARVEALEDDNAVHKWTHDELIAIKLKYREKRKKLLTCPDTMS